MKKKYLSLAKILKLNKLKIGQSVASHVSEPDTLCLVLFSHWSMFGSGSELRKSSGWTGHTLGLDEFCVTSCLVSSDSRTVVHTVALPGR